MVVISVVSSNVQKVVGCRSAQIVEDLQQICFFHVVFIFISIHHFWQPLHLHYFTKVTFGVRYSYKKTVYWRITEYRVQY